MNNKNTVKNNELSEKDLLILRGIGALTVIISSIVQLGLLLKYGNDYFIIISVVILMICETYLYLSRKKIINYLMKK